MTEKLDLETDEQLSSKTLFVGKNTITGFEMFRRFVALNTDLRTKENRFTYEEWEIALDGKLYEEFYRVKEYIVVDIQELKTTPFSQWIKQLESILVADVCENLMKRVPLVCESGFVPTDKIFQNE